MKKVDSDFLKGEVRLVTINPVWSYYGEIVGKDSDYVYFVSKKDEVSYCFPIYNICKISNEVNKGVDNHG